jgi:hypothetical protein
MPRKAVSWVVCRQPTPSSVQPGSTWHMVSLQGMLMRCQAAVNEGHEQRSLLQLYQMQATGVLGQQPWHLTYALFQGHESYSIARTLTWCKIRICVVSVLCLADLWLHGQHMCRPVSSGASVRHSRQQSICHAAEPCMLWRSRVGATGRGSAAAVASIQISRSGCMCLP